ncbi:MAG TPA: MarR family winged helix-turn-helix transcriptional regulator [Devosia sp.]|jgi:DNA-binding MarR family transcriptional regulator|uniref:MarR family winged helix-turn-helix transcriptional regulator n=1 Tax=Devosia sp. TaxID=1871048 RepID=UPI002DDD8C43|nr:MarR family winged helix-turn-helix transcriptional regulator [Devosia sp.]HEV2516869.1 MarR family winged helix-turn-helix transcriptional regulator [Devosia sp.]
MSSSKSGTGRGPFPDLPTICQTRGDREMVELAEQAGLSPNAAEAVASIDAVMHKVRRSIQRRDFGRQVMAQMDPSLDVSHLDAISAIAHKGEEITEVTVGLVAERLAIDPSRASRVTSDLVERGYARRVASQQDARRICLELTGKGNSFVEAVRRNKVQIFTRALAQWNEHELMVFASLFERFSNWATDENGAARSAENIRRLLDEAEATPKEVADAK